MFDALVWTATVMSIVGALLNAQRRISGFYYWIPANLAWIAIACHKDLYGQAVLFIFYTGFCVYGVYRWRKPA